MNALAIQRCKPVPWSKRQQAVRRRQGRGNEPFDFPCIRHVFVAEDDAEARRLGTDYIECYMKSTALFRPIGEHERARMVFGGVETCIEKLRCLQDEGGVNYILGWMNFGGMPHDMVSRSMQLFAEAVMPALRDDAGADPFTRFSNAEFR